MEQASPGIDFLVVITTSGIARGSVRMTATTKNFAQDGGHTPANRLTKTCRPLFYSFLL